MFVAHYNRTFQPGLCLFKPATPPRLQGQNDPNASWKPRPQQRPIRRFLFVLREFWSISGLPAWKIIVVQFLKSSTQPLIITCFLSGFKPTHPLPWRLLLTFAKVAVLLTDVKVITMGHIALTNEIELRSLRDCFLFPRSYSIVPYGTSDTGQERDILMGYRLYPLKRFSPIKLSKEVPAQSSSLTP